MTPEPRFQVRKDEVRNAVGIQILENALALDGLAPDLPYRKIYLYFEPKIVPVNGDFSIQAELRMYRDVIQVGEPLPCDQAFDTNGRVARSAFTVFGNSQT